MPEPCKSCAPDEPLAQRALRLCLIAVTMASVLAGVGLRPALGQQSDPGLQSDLASALYTDAALTVHFRSYFMDRSLPGVPDQAAWANGGWIGYQSGWFGDLVRVGLVGYASAAFWAPDDRDGTLLLRERQQSYAVLGQAYVALKLWDQIITGYRQLVDQPEVNPRDNRMTPNTFEGVSIAGTFQPFDYYAALLWAMKGRNETRFRDMASIAGVVDADRSMWLGSIGFRPFDDLKLRASAYLVPDVLWSSYADVAWLTPLAGDAKLRLGGQFMYQESDGGNLLTGSSFDTWAGGIKADLVLGPLVLTGAYTRVGDNAQYRSPYGTWAGYTSMIANDFSRAREEALLIGGVLDFAFLGLPGMSFTTYAVFGDRAINATTRQPLSDKNEYDLTLDYRFTAGYWPEPLRPLWLRARAAYIDERFGGVTRTTKDYRLIVNYEWAFRKSPAK